MESMSIACGRQTSVILSPVGQGTTSAQPDAAVHKLKSDLRVMQHTGLESSKIRSAFDVKPEAVSVRTDRQAPRQSAGCPTKEYARPSSIQPRSTPQQMRLVLASCADCKGSGNSEQYRVISNSSYPCHLDRPGLAIHWADADEPRTRSMCL